MAYQPIENYGIIGDMRTAALIGLDGSVDWFCLPHFDSPSLFAAILDDRKGGRFSIAPVEKSVSTTQSYLSDTNVLVTRFQCKSGVAELTDFLPVDKSEKSQLVRTVLTLAGAVEFRMFCQPAFNYGRDVHKLRLSQDGASFKSIRQMVSLQSSVALTESGDGSAFAEFALNAGERAFFVLSPGDSLEKAAIPQADQLLRDTVGYWRTWVSQCTYNGHWQEMVRRSALTLKLLTFAPTGAVIAAATTSLPETIGGERNWDYRFTWIRDASLMLRSLLRIGFHAEAEHFLQWLEARLDAMAPHQSLQIMYGLDGRQPLSEETLGHLDGYRNSKPVRIGNAAYGQLQLDIIGELMDLVYLFDEIAKPISPALWSRLRGQIDWVCNNWQRKDEGIWEVRGGRQHFVYSKLMCWVAIDRGLRLARRRRLDADSHHWTKTRDKIRDEIHSKGWNPERRAFTQAYGRPALDASTLMIPLAKFLPATHKRVLQTLDAIVQPISKGGLVQDDRVYRYNALDTPDGLSGEEGTFNICTFWLVEVLAGAGRHAQAKRVFSKMLRFGNHLGLLAEETGSKGEALGNFPQAFSHLALIDAASALADSESSE